MLLSSETSFQIICTSSAIFLNSLLIYLALYKSPKQLGVYKYLMIYISIFELIHSIAELVIDPIIHSNNAAVVVLRDINNSIFDREQSYFLNNLYCGLLGTSMSIFGVHFIYRYGTINKKFWGKFLERKKVLVLFLLPIVYGIVWTVICQISFRPTLETDAFMSYDIKTYYNLEIDDSSYLAIVFHKLDENGIHRPIVQTFLTMLCLVYIIFSSLFCVFFFGIKCYLNIHNSLKRNANVSKFTRTLQRQLFKALVTQTLIPIILLFIPIGIVTSAPMFNYKLSFNINFTAWSISIYPAIDPLPSLFLIQNFRRAISNSACSLFSRCLSKNINIHTVKSVSGQNKWNANSTL